MHENAASFDASVSLIGNICDALSSLSLPPAGLEQLRTLSKDQFSAIPLGKLGLDESLGAMEFCIQLEIGCGIVVSPEDLVVVDCAGDLLALIEARIDSSRSHD